MPVELLYCKSKVYIHPSKSKKDNVPGYLALVKPPNANNTEILLSFIPESLLKGQQDYDTFVKVDMDPKSGSISQETVLVSASQQTHHGTHAFSIPLSSIYSIKVRLPSIGWWWGSLLVFQKSQIPVPALFFHDDESASTKAEQDRRNSDFSTFKGGLFWGGQAFLDVLGSYAKLVKSTIEPGVFLVNPDVVDKLNFSPAGVKHVRQQPQTSSLAATWQDAKWGLLEKLASVTRLSRNASQKMLDRTPSSVKAMLNQPEVEQLSRDFDSARVYLTEWALGIANDTKQSKTDIIWTDGYNDVLESAVGDFDVLSLNRAIERRNPVTLDEWNSFFDPHGRLAITVNEVKERIFHGGLEPGARPEAWLFLLGLYPWDSDSHARLSIASEKRNEYYRLKRKWWDDVDLQNTDAFWKDQKSRIEKDVLRTDRNLEIFGQSQVPHPDPESRFASSGANPHLEQLKDLLITYNEYNINLGYVQGMSDLLSPLYVVLQDDALAFWAFCGFMERMERNFLRTQSGMHDQLSTLDQLVQLLLPKLYAHLKKAESTHFFFFFRMLLVWYKREFTWDDSIRLWEVFWTDHLSSQFHLFVAAAILDLNKEIVMERFHQFDEILKYFNDLGPALDVDDVLVRAEQLFKRFSKTVEVIDRKNKAGQETVLPEVTESLRALLSTEVIIVKEDERPPGAMGG